MASIESLFWSMRNISNKLFIIGSMLSYLYKDYDVRPSSSFNLLTSTIPVLVIRLIPVSLSSLLFSILIMLTLFSFSWTKLLYSKTSSTRNANFQFLPRHRCRIKLMKNACSDDVTCPYDSIHLTYRRQSEKLNLSKWWLTFTI